MEQLELFAEFANTQPLDPKRAKQRAMIEELQARPLVGGRIEEGQTLMALGGAEGENLFNRAAPAVEVIDPREQTPMLRQYLALKRSIQANTFLFYRIGDFYEMFFDDAVRAAPVLGVAESRRAGVPMCGVPHHAIDAYLAKMANAGYKVAIAEQVEDPAPVKRGIIRREVVRIISEE